MRRIHPQRAKAPLAPLQDSFVSSDIGLATRNNRSKSWMSVSDLRRHVRSQYGNKNGNNSKGCADGVDGSYSRNVLAIGNESGGAANKNETCQVFHHHETGEVEKDSDSDFEESPAKKSRRPNVSSTPGASQRHRSSTGPEKSDQMKQTTDQSSSKILFTHAQTHSDTEIDLEDLWSPSQDPFDLDFRMDTVPSRGHSPLPREANDIHSSPSVALDMQRTLDEIDDLLMEDSESPTPTLDIRPTTSYEKRATKELTLFHDTFALRCDPTFASGGDPIAMDEVIASRASSVRDIGHRHDNTKEAVVDSSKDDQDRSDVGMNTGSPLVLDGIGEMSQRQDQELVLSIPAFDLPASTVEFAARLEDIQTRFKLSLDSMSEAVRGVDSLHALVKDTLTEQQSYLDERGKNIALRVQGLQMEASGLLQRT